MWGPMPSRFVPFGLAHVAAIALPILSGFALARLVRGRPEEGAALAVRVTLAGLSPPHGFVLLTALRGLASPGARRPPPPVRPRPPPAVYALATLSRGWPKSSGSGRERVRSWRCSPRTWATASRTGTSSSSSGSTASWSCRRSCSSSASRFAPGRAAPAVSSSSPPPTRRRGRGERRPGNELPVPLPQAAAPDAPRRVRALARLHRGGGGARPGAVPRCSSFPSASGAPDWIRRPTGSWARLSARLCFGRTLGRRALAAGAFGAMLPDVDIVMNATGPMAEWLYHRGPPTRSGSCPWWERSWGRRPGAPGSGAGIPAARGRSPTGGGCSCSRSSRIRCSTSARATAPSSSPPSRTAASRSTPSPSSTRVFSLLFAAALPSGFSRVRARGGPRLRGSRPSLLSTTYLAYGLRLNHEAESRARAQLAEDGGPGRGVRAYPTRSSSTCVGSWPGRGRDSRGLAEPLESPPHRVAELPPGARHARGRGASHARRPALRVVRGGQTAAALIEMPGGRVVEIDDLRYGFPPEPRRGLWAIRVRFDEDGRVRAPVERVDRPLPEPALALLRQIWRETFRPMTSGPVRPGLRARRAGELPAVMGRVHRDEAQRFGRGQVAEERVGEAGRLRTRAPGPAPARRASPGRADRRSPPAARAALPPGVSRAPRARPRAGGAPSGSWAGSASG